MEEVRLGQLARKYAVGCPTEATAAPLSASATPPWAENRGGEACERPFSPVALALKEERKYV